MAPAGRNQGSNPNTGTVTGEARIVTSGFQSRVYAMVKKVPRGQVTTYGDVAGALGSRRVARQVGFALSALDKVAGPQATAVPWQRVINAQGRISFKGDLFRAKRQRELLDAEGIRFDDSGRVLDLEAHRHQFKATARVKGRVKAGRVKAGRVKAGRVKAGRVKARRVKAGRAKAAP